MEYYIPINTGLLLTCRQRTYVLDANIFHESLLTYERVSQFYKAVGFVCELLENLLHCILTVVSCEIWLRKKASDFA